MLIHDWQHNQDQHEEFIYAVKNYGLSLIIAILHSYLVSGSTLYGSGQH